MQASEPFRFHSPSSIMVVGPSGCGKTVFTSKLLTSNRHLFQNPPSSVVYCYGAWQEKFKALKRQGVKFHEGIPELHDLTKWFPGGGVLILDDLMDEGGNDKRVLDLFTKHSHHQNVTVLFLCQDIFPNGKHSKTISRNAHYMVAFKNPRDQIGFRNLAQQCFPTKHRAVQERYQSVTSTPFGYMVLDFHPSSDDNKRLLSHLLDDEGYTRCYPFTEDGTE